VSISNQIEAKLRIELISKQPLAIYLLVLYAKEC